LKTVFLKGEISNLMAHSTGHFYFTLKADNSRISAIMFSTNTKRLTFTPTEGSKVLVTGRVSIYETTGNYQIYVEDMIEDGIGNLYIAFEKLKNKLTEEGLFDSKYKKPIPKIPDKIGVVTAPTGAAIKDIITTIKRRFPLSQIYLFPALVQGENASSDIVKKIGQADAFGLDVLIVGRGGGSIEDLWPFNEEIVARAIFACQTPVISAVGHEIDYTISDFVSDLRAPTPTGAGELAVPNLKDLLLNLDQLSIRLNENINKQLKIKQIALNNLKNNYILKKPQIIYENHQQKLDGYLIKLTDLINYKYEKACEKLSNIKKNNILINPHTLYEKQATNLNYLIDKLNIINPLNVLKRGYNITYKENNIVKSIDDIKIDDVLKLRLCDGTIETKVIGKEHIDE
ncbi:MAG: exodeoxyribonuclease VII large subunit, partial [Bacilli bacterium]|nr:exodeoxyribonuclease VII large subunit [Bacilli bacterium]